MMSEPEKRPTLAEARQLLGSAETYDVQLPEDPVLIAEQAVVGSAIQSSARAAEALAILRPENFSPNAPQIVSDAVRHLADAGVPVELTSVLSELASARVLAKLHGQDMGTGGVYLHSLAQRCGDIGYHAPKV